MKKIYTTIAAFVMTLCLFAQVPQMMSYQAVIRDASSNLIKSLPVGMRISILQGSISGAIVYSETQMPVTNINGLVSIEIGGGTGFNNIDWSNGPYFIKTETDPNGGTNYTITGTSQLLSVPYAIYSRLAQTADYNNLTNLPNLSNYLTSESDPVFGAAAAHGIVNNDITNWNIAYSWGNHAGLYRSISYVPAWIEITGKPSFSPVSTTGSFSDLSNKPTTVGGYGITDAMTTTHSSFGITSTLISNWTTAYSWGNHANAGYLTSFTETDPKIGAINSGFSPKWNGSTLVTGAVFQDASGNVGIGTESPTNKLSITGSADMSTSVQSPLFTSLPGVSNPLTIQTNDGSSNTGSMTIRTGDVSANGPVSGSLTLRGGNYTGGYKGAQLLLQGYPGSNGGGSAILSGGDGWADTGGDVSIVGGNKGWGNGGTVYINGGSGGAGAGGGGHIILTTGNDASAGPGVIVMNISGTEALRVNGTGNVGIGTNAPASKLDVNGVITSIGGNSSNWNTAFSWGNHAGLYRPASYVPSWTEITNKPATAAGYGISDAVTTTGNQTVGGDKTFTGTTTVQTPVHATDAANKVYVDSKIPSHYIGESYGGGIVFYVYDNGLHGLIAATVDATVNGTSMLRWIYNAATARTAGAGGNGIGAGKTNTLAMLAMQYSLTPTAPSLSTFSAAVAAANYFATDAQGVRYGDWYLPSSNEMILATQSGVVPNLASYYWSSTEASDNSNYAFAIYGGSITVQGKDGSFNVRAIRSF